MLKASVIITTYNSSSTIKAALDSVLEQLNVILEIIIVDDHSSDYETLASIVEHYQHSMITVLQPAQKGNANVSRNLGIFAAKYDYVAFLDADDSWNPNHLNIAIQTLENQRADIVFSRVQFTREGRVVSFSQPEYKGSIAEYIFSNGTAVTSSLVARKAPLDMCTFDEKQLKHQDWDFLIRAQNSGLIVTQSDYVGLSYTLSTGSNMSSSFNPEATVRFLQKTLSNEYHEQMLLSQINAMITSGRIDSLKRLKEITGCFELSFTARFLMSLHILRFVCLVGATARLASLPERLMRRIKKL